MKSSKKRQPCSTCRYTGNCPDEKNGREFTTKLFGMDCWKPKPEPISKPSIDPNGNPLEDLFGSDPNCEHEVVSAPGGGVKCKKCTGWFCF